MKKLMIAAAAVAMIGAAQAEGTACTIAPTPADAAVFVWKFQGKTTAGVAAESIIGATACNLGTPEVCAIRVPAALAIQGYTYICENCCEAYTEDGWKNQFATGTFFLAKPFKSSLEVNTDSKATGHIIGKKASQYELFGNLIVKSLDPEVKYDLTFAGLGTWNKSKVLPTAVSGNFAGTAEAPYFIGYIGKQLVCINADWWLCGSYSYAQKPDAKSVAYGAWSMRYNSTASKNYKKGITIALPAWVRAIAQ